MGSLSNVYIKKENLEVLLKTIEAKGEKGVSIDISINETSNDYGQNLSAYISQTKEQREAKTPRYYVGNGKCFWTDGVIKIAEKKAEVHTAVPIPQSPATDDVPF